MLVEGSKDRGKVETEVKDQSGREQPSLYAMLGTDWLSARSVGLQSFLPV